MHKRMMALKHFLTYLPMEEGVGLKLLSEGDRNKLYWLIKQFSKNNLAEREAAVSLRQTEDRRVTADQKENIIK